MKYLAERTAEHPLKTVSSKFDFHKTYHEEDLFIDIWAYKDQVPFVSSFTFAGSTC